MAQLRSIAEPQDILDLQKVQVQHQKGWVHNMLQVLAMAAPHYDVKCNEMLGFMLDEAKVVG